MKNIIACNLGSYRQFGANAYTHLAEIGLTNVEIGVPADDAVDKLQSDLKAHGLTATSLLGRCDVQSETVVTDFQRTLNIANEMDVKVIFVSVHAGETDKRVVYERLRAIGENAEPLDVRVCLETHPDMAHNGDIALETMKGVNHPNIRINFDTGNVYYYNHDVNAVTEVEKIIDYVGAVHLKDTNGGYRTWHFPTLGEGVVDYKAVFQTLNDAGFYGPFTMELEGIEGENLDEAGVQTRVADSLQHLKDIGVI
ncbi:sugar phosphate isomerase/epimerase [Candidatus Poribacteria bacterium]|nr:sugar phosphate isomerase/epimerase [Candidatus Poribacteria bacterium]MYF55033.1 sugar phosphate isomerase/epimerase [Candidatus Poribacteria bacterium]MYI94209.1 sugar phosphate isomerase/epimerase [Candidatus Poribacteria bacterium]